MKKLYLHVICTICLSFIVILGYAQTATYDPSVFINININSGNPTCPFPQFLEYTGGGKSLAKYNAEGVTHADMEKTLREAYEIMMHRCRYEGTYCGVRYISFNRDDVPGNYGTFVSEGDGYALLAAAIFADQKTFNGLYMWIHDIRFSGVKRFRDGGTRGLNANDFAGPYLAAWKDKTFNAAYGSDSHSATDGDVDIAMAMLIAYKQWGEWMMQDGQVVKDNQGNPISLKYETQRVVGALVDTLGQWDKGSGQLTGMLSGVIGIDGYEKRGNSWGELTRWRFTDAATSRYPNINGPYNGGPNLLSIYGGNYIDYDAPSYFEEFWRWLKNGDGVDDNNRAVSEWEIHQFKRAAASGNWLNKKAYDQGLYASIGRVEMATDGQPTFGVYVDGEDFRYPWRHILDYLWHGDADYDWDPVSHQVIDGTNNSERLMGIRHAGLLKNPSNSGTQICAKQGASPDPGQPQWFGVSQIPQQWTHTGGITSAYHTNYSVGAGATAAVASEDLELIADIYRQCELMWDGNNTAAKLDPEERYIGSTPKYFHGWFRTLGMLVCSGNMIAPEQMVPKANMKVYMSVDKTYAYEGDRVSYTVQYRNYGSLNATGVTIQTPLDEDYTFVSANKGGVYDPATHTITWNIGTVPGFKSGGLAATIDSVAFTVRITSLANDRVCETSTISGDNFPEWISNEYPNHATYTMERNCVDVLANRSLVVEKTANRKELNPNDNVTFTVDFENVSSDDSWLNGGRDNVRISYGNYYMNGNAYQFYHLYRFWNDSYEAYINMNNYRVSYFMFDAAAQGLYSATNQTGWTFVVDNQNDLDKYGYNPSSGPITFAYQKIPQGEDRYGKWNQRLMIRFADVLMAPSTHVYDKLDSQYLLHKGVWGPGFIRARLASNPATDLTARVQDDWSFSTDITAGTIDGQGETFTLISPCWANYDNLGYEIDNYSRHTCSRPISRLTNFDRVLVEEFDGYTWRRIQGRGPLPGKEAYHVTIVDTIPKELRFNEFVTKKALGIEATYTAAPAGASYSGIVKWTIPEMLVGEKGKLVYSCTANDIGCPNAADAHYINAAWIYSDTDSPDSSSVELTTTCTDLPPYIEPQNSLFKTASQTTASVGDVISYEVKYVNTTGTIVDENCSSTTNWMPLGNGSMSSVSNGTLKLSTNGGGAFFFGPKYSYGKNGEVLLKFSGCNSVTQDLYFVMRYKSGTPGSSNFRGIAMKLRINIDGANRFGYTLYNNGTQVAEEGTSWANAMSFPGSSSAPVLKFVLNDDHLYLYINDEENDWTTVVKDWGGLTTDAGNFGLYVNSNGNGQLAIDNFYSNLDYAYDITLSDELPDELTNISNISGSGTYNASNKKITWPAVAGPIAPNEEISYTFDATVYSCNAYINNYATAKVYGQEDVRVVNSVKCGTTVCPDPPVASNIECCVGDVKTLTATATGNNRLKWYDADKVALASTTIPTTEAAVLTYYVSQVGSCESDLTEVTVTVRATEKPEVSDVSYCKNQSNVTALSVDGDNIKWYNSSKVELGDAPVPDVSAESETTYYVTQTQNDCESDYAAITVSVGALAPPTVTSPVSYCQGETATALTATATGTLQWYTSESSTTAETSIVPSTATVATTKYYVSQSSGECESERAEIEVVVKDKPVSSISASADSYCGDASTVNLSISSEHTLTGATYSWQKDGGDISDESSITNAEAGEYTCVVTLDGCSYTTEAKTITQNESPAYTISGDGSYCPESESKTPVVITFTAGKAPFTFTENVTGANTSTENTFTIDNPSGGVYKLTSLTDDNGCEMTATAASVEVVDLETPDLSIVSIPSVCAGSDAVDVSNYVTAGTGTLSYETDKGTITAAGVLSDLTTAGEYTVTVKLKGTTAPYCVNTQTATVTVAENPSVSLAATYTVCSESDLELTPTNNGTSTYSYAWAGDGATKLNSTSLDNPTFNAEVTADTDYTLELTVTDRANSCSSTVFTTVTTYALPTVTLSADKDFVCSDAELEVTATVSGSGTGEWTNATEVTETTATIDGSANAAGPLTVSYVYTDGHSCKSKEATKDFTIVAKPDKPQVTTISYCLNADVTEPLSLVGVANPLWYGTTGTETPSTTGPVPSTASVGTTKYYVSQVVDGCESEQAELSVVVKDKLVPEIVLSNASVCKGTAVNVSLSQEFKSQTWSGTAATNLNSTTMAAPTFLASADAGTYTLQVSVEDASGCMGTSEDVTITVNPIPVVSLATPKAGNCISESTAQTITATIEPSDLNGTFQWTNVTNDSKASASFVPSSHNAGDYEVTYQFTSDANCASNVATLTMSVYALPEITITPSKTDVCASGENSADVTMTPSLTTGTFEYSVDNGTIGTDGTLPTSNGAGTYTITLMYTDGNSCQKSAETVVTIHELPDVKFANTNPTEICYNTSAVTLAVEPATTMAASYKFVGTSGASSAEFNPATAAVGANAITYTYTDAFGCQNSATHNLDVVKVLAPTVDAPNPKTVTIDDFGVLLDVTTMTATANVSTDVLIWQDEARTQLETGNSYESPETTEGQYSYFVKEYRTINGKACYSDSTLATLVLSNCSAKSPTAESKKLCVGDDGAITLTATNAGDTRKLSWFSDQAITTVLQDDADSYATTVSTASAGVFTYYVAEYDANKDCWSVPTPVTVTVNDLPQVSINQIDYLCYADGTYTAAGTINSVASTAGTWSVVGDKITVDAQSGVIDLTSAGKNDGTYTLRYSYTDGNGCSNYAEEEFVIEYPDKPESDGYLGIVSKPLTVEVSAKATSLEANYSEVHWYASTTASTYETGDSWQPGDDPATEHTTTYYLTQVVNGCESEKAEALVQIVSCPFAKPDVVSAEACQKATSLDDLQASLPTTTTVPADKWIWYDANKNELTAGTANTYASGVSTETADVTTFYVGYLATEPTTQEQCPSPLAEVTVTIHELPSVTITPVDNAICYELGDYQMSATVNGAMMTAGNWSVENNAAVVSSYGIFNSKQNGQVDASYNVRYTYTDQNTNCTNYDELTVTVEYPEIPSASDYAGLTSQPDPVVLNAQNIETQGTANWYANGVVASNSTQWTTDDNPSQAHTSIYNLSQTVQGCESEKVSVTVTINDCPFMAPVATGTEICQDETNLSDISAALPASTTVSADAWIWYDSNKNELTRGTANSFATGVSTATSGTHTFYVSYLATDALSHIQCESAKAEVTVVVNPLPEITFDQSNKQLVCYDGGDVVWKATVDYHSNGVGNGSWAVDGTENNGITSAGVFNPTAFGEQTGTYEISYTYTDGKSCVNTAKQNIKVQYVGKPMPIADFTSMTELNEPVELYAQPYYDGTWYDGNDVPPFELTWYDANGIEKYKTDDDLIGFSTNDKGDVVTHKSYYVTMKVNGCESEKAEQKVDIFDCPVPKPIVVQPDAMCNYDDAPEIQVSFGTWTNGSRKNNWYGPNFKVYSDEFGGEPIYLIEDDPFIPTIDDTKSGTYTYWIAEVNNEIPISIVAWSSIMGTYVNKLGTTASCESKRVKVTVEVKKPQPPTVNVIKQEVCFGEKNPTLTAVAQGNVQWYETEPAYPATDSDAERTSYISTQTEVGTHTVWATQMYDNCLSEATSVTFTVKPNPAAPIVADVSICESAPKESLCATPADGGTITWYTNENRTGQLSKLTCYTPPVTYPDVYEYYASQTVDGCESETQKATYTIRRMPLSPVVQTNPVTCIYDSEHELSVPEQQGITVAWYSSADTTSKLYEGNTFTHQITDAGTKRYYVRQIENGCVGNYSVASFVIAEQPAQPITTDDVVCQGSTATLYTDGPRDVWYTDETLNEVAGVGYSISIPEVNQKTTYYVVRERNGCQSLVSEVSATIIEQPTLSITVDDEEVSIIKRCVYDEEPTLTASVSPAMSANDYVEWNIFPGNKTVKGGESIVLSDYVTLSSTSTSGQIYTVRAQYMVKNTHKDIYCPSVVDTVKMQTNSKARTPIVLSKVICQGEEIEPMIALGSPNTTWLSQDGILPLVATGMRYEFAKQQNDLPVGNYRFKVFDISYENGCHSDTADVELTLAPAAQTKIYGKDSVCVNTTEEYYTKYSEESTYMWTVSGGNLNYSKDMNSSSIRYVDWSYSGIDTVVVFEQTWAGCRGSDTLVVKVAANPRAMFGWSLPGSSNVVELRDSTVQDSIIDVTATGERIAEEVPYTLYWNYGHAGSPTDAVDLEVPYRQRLNYIYEDGYEFGYNCPILTVENSYGCSDTYSDCIFINVTSGLYVPTAFAPMNPSAGVRFFQPKGYNLKTCHVSVYDKWGNLVWYSDEVEDGMFVGKWDGRCNGKMMMADTYIWKMDATFTDDREWEGFKTADGKRVKFGNVTLIR